MDPSSTVHAGGCHCVVHDIALLKIGMINFSVLSEGKPLQVEAPPFSLMLAKSGRQRHGEVMKSPGLARLGYDSKVMANHDGPISFLATVRLRLAEKAIVGESL